MVLREERDKHFLLHLKWMKNLLMLFQSFINRHLYSSNRYALEYISQSNQMKEYLDHDMFKVFIIFLEAYQILREFRFM